MSSNVFNNTIGSPYDFSYPKYTREQERDVIGSLFEQLLIFEKVTITTNSINFSLSFLIRRLGINTVERLFESNYIDLMIWTPVILSGGGRHQPDGTIDKSVIYGQPPISAGSLTDQDKDPEKNIHYALSNFHFHKDRKRSFTKIALKNYIVPDGMEFSKDSTKLILDAYKNNNLQSLGLPYNKEPEQLEIPERALLLNLGHKLLETAILSKFNLKSFENYEHYAICKQNLKNIGKAYNLNDNVDSILKLEGLPNLKQLFIEERFNFDSVFKIRHYPTAKYFRSWINEVGENCNAQEITSEYLKEVKGKYRFLETNEGKFIKNLFSYGANSALGTVLAGPAGAVAGIALGLLETFWIDSLLKGKNPSMFIDRLKDDIIQENN